MGSSALAQAGGGFARAFQPEVSPRDMVLFHSHLRLDDDQRVIIETLIRDYNETLRELVDEMRYEMTETAENMDRGDEQAMVRQILEPINRMQKQRDELTEELYLDIRLQLSESQLERWPSLMRKITRFNALPRGRLAGESLDLILELDRLDLDEVMRQSISAMERDYELRLHELLTAREEKLGDIENRSILAITARDSDSALRIVNEEVRLRRAIRDHNLEYVEVFASALPPGDRDSFRRRAMASAYPRVYRTQFVEGMLDAAVELDGLSDSIREAVTTLRDVYQIELAETNERLVSLINRHEPEQVRDRMQRRVDRQRRGVGGGDDPIREAYRDRDQLNQRYVEDLQALLTPEQFRALPGAARTAVGAARGDRGSSPQQFERRRGGRDAPDQGRGDRGNRGDRGDQRRGRGDDNR